MGSKTFIVLTFLYLLLMTATIVQGASSYGITALPITPNLNSYNSYYKYGRPINNNGNVVGYLVNGNDLTGSIWSAANGTQPIPPLNGDTNSDPFGINDSGQVMGYSYLIDPTTKSQIGYAHAFLWSADNGTQQIPPTTGDNVNYLLAINDSGQVLGGSYLIDPIIPQTGPHAFIWSPNGTQPIPPLPGYTGSAAVSMNDSGQVVGYSYLTNPITNQNYGEKACIWSAANGTQPIPPLTGDTAVVLGEPFGVSHINDNGQVVSYSFFSDPNTYLIGARHAFIWSAAQGTQTIIPPLPGDTDSVPYGINDSGQVVGYSYHYDPIFPQTVVGPHAFIWSAVKGTQPIPPHPGGNYVVVMNINDSGQVVGYTSAGAFIWSAANGTKVLNGLISDSSWDLRAAYSINNGGQILGYGTHNGTGAYFLLTPHCKAQVTKLYQSPLSDPSAAAWNPPLYPNNDVSKYALSSSFNWLPYAYHGPPLPLVLGTMRKYGCTTTALAMGLVYAGLTNIALPTTLTIPEALLGPIFPPTVLASTDPGTLNLFMEEVKGCYDAKSDPNWDVTVRKTDIVTGAKTGNFLSLHFDSKSFTDPTSADDLEKLVCEGDKGQPAPVFVRVNNNQHTVLVTEMIKDAQGNRTFKIADPFYIDKTDLSAYGNNFIIKGVITDPSDNSGLDISLSVPADKAQLILTDINGNRTGFDANTGTVLNQIPGASYDSHVLVDEETGVADPGTSYFLNIFNPAQSSYTVSVLGTGNGTYDLSIMPFSLDGSQQPPFEVQGVSSAGSIDTYQVSYSSIPGQTSTIVQLCNR